MGKKIFGKEDDGEDLLQNEGEAEDSGNQNKKRMKNKLKLNKFHQIKRVKHEKENKKKKLRSLKRLLNKVGDFLKNKCLFAYINYQKL